MKGKTVIVAILMVLFLIFAGVFYLHKVIESEPSQENTQQNDPVNSGETQNLSVEKTVKNQQGNSTQVPASEASVLASPLDKKDKKNILSKLPVVDQKIPKKDEKEIAKTIDVQKSTIEKYDTSDLNKSEIYFTLYNGELNSLLIDYDVDFIYFDATGTTKVEKYKTNEKGVFQVKVFKIGYFNYQLKTIDYADYSNTINLPRGKTEINIKLFKGGTLEIRPTNSSNKIVEGLIVKFGNGKRFQTQENLFFDANRNLYVMNNIPLGTLNFYFKAPGYLDSMPYIIKIEPKNTSILEIKLVASRKVFLDININPKPETIKVINGKVSFIDNKAPYNGTIVSKNSTGLFEISADERNFQYITVIIDKFIPKEVSLSPDKEIFQVNFETSFEGKLYVNDENGKGIEGASVSYGPENQDKTVPTNWSTENFDVKGPGRSVQYGSNRQISITDKNGMATLYNLNEKVALSLSISHKYFTPMNDTWSFDAGASSSKTVVLSAGKGISGKVKCNEKLVVGAKVFLLYTGSASPILSMDTDSEGSFCFNKLDEKIKQDYILKAFHIDFGVAVSQTIKIDDKLQVIELNLVPEKSVSLKLIDSSGKIIPNKDIILAMGYNQDRGGMGLAMDMNARFANKTNDKGECEFFNLIHGYYTATINDEKYIINEKGFNVPSGLVELNTKEKILKKLLVTSNGLPYKGLLEAKQVRNLFPLEVTKGDDGSFYLEFVNENFNVFGMILFDAPGHAVTLTGPYKEVKSMPNEINVDLIEGDSVNLKVVDGITGKPLSFVKVDIFSGDLVIQSKPTNEIGEINFANLAGKLTASVKPDMYAPYKLEFNPNKTKEVILKVIHGGTLKVYMTVNMEMRTLINLQPLNQNMNLNADGRLELKNISPGEYSLTVIEQNIKDGKNNTYTLPNKIIIKNDETLELNLDEVKKN